MSDILLFVVIEAAHVVYCLVGLNLFYRNRNHIYLQKRNPNVVLLMGVSTLLLGCMYLLNRKTLPSSAVPCICYVWVNFIFAPAWMLSFFLRALHLVYLHKVNMLKMDAPKDGKVHPVVRILGKIFRLKSTKSNPDISTVSGVNSMIIPETSNPVTFEVYGAISNRALLTAEGVLLLLGVALAVATTFLYEVTLDSLCTSDVFNLLYGIIAVYLLTLPYFLFLLKGIHDEYYIRMELTVSLFVFYPFYAIYMTLSYALPPPFSEYAIFFLYALGTLTFTFSTYAVVFLAHRASTRLSKLTFSKESFDKVIKTRMLFDILKKIAAEQYSIENALFHEKLWDFSQNKLKSLSQEKSIAVYESFIPRGSANELNIPEKLRRSLEQQMQNNQLTAESLRIAHAEVLDMLYKNSFPRFVLITKIESI